MVGRLRRVPESWGPQAHRRSPGIPLRVAGSGQSAMEVRLSPQTETEGRCRGSDGRRTDTKPDRKADTNRVKPLFVSANKFDPDCIRYSNEKPRRNSLSHRGLREAGDGIRTRDFQLGKLALYLT